MRATATAQKKFAGKRVANRADLRLARKLGLDYCMRCRFVYIVTAEAKRCGCGTKGVVTAPNAKQALRIAQKQVAPRVHGWRRVALVARFFATLLRVVLARIFG